MASISFLGIDVGTSGIRAMVINNEQAVLASSMKSMPPPKQSQANHFEQDPTIWAHTLTEVLNDLAQQYDLNNIKAVSLDATSGTVLLVNKQGQPISKALMYNDQRATDFAKQIQLIAPIDSPSCSASSGLAKALWLLNENDNPTEAFISHQADWLNGQLSNQFGFTDSNNALKTGYDPIAQQWPSWIEQLGIKPQQLPTVSNPGTVLFPLDKNIVKQFGFNSNILLVSGTTDSTAALLATGANQVGDAVTSLGSSLVLKIISDKPISSTEHGVYSQPYGKHWLVGGASNTGGAVLRHYFNDSQMAQLEQQLNPEQPTGLNYYPLLQKGERFPINNPEHPSCLTPRPKEDSIFFQAMLEGISTIEQQGYSKLEQLGAPKAKRLFSVGGGTKNKIWTSIRQQRLNIPMQNVTNPHAAFGAALFAKQGYDSK